MALSERQVRFFETFGYLSFPGAFSDEAAAITEQFERVWTKLGGGHNGKAHDQVRRSCFVPFIDQSEYLSALLDDPRIDDVASSLLGDDYNYETSDGNYYVGDSTWHSDRFAPKYRHLKFAFYLDPVGRESGCLRVIPGSHHSGDSYSESLQKRVRPQPGTSAAVNHASPVEDSFGVLGSDVPAVALESQPGDLLLFSQALKHSSYGGGTRRRMFTINVSERFGDDDRGELKENIGSLARFWAERAYGEIMIRTASRSRMRHLEQRLANDGHLVELVRQKRGEMAEPSRG